MSDEKQLINNLDALADKYSHDKKALQAVNYLKSLITGDKISNGNLVTNNLMPAQMPLPSEINKKNQMGLYSDGGCLGNPGPGAWAAFAQNHLGEVVFESTAFDGNTTNNRMEMNGVINGLLRIIDHAEGKRGCFEVFVYTDSKYVVDGVNQWMPNWKKNGWKKADQKTPENLVLWQQLDEVLVHPAFIRVHLNWVRGHAGHPQNEYCDRLCQNLLKQVLGQ